MDTQDLPPIEPGDDLDRAIRRAQAEKRSDRLFLVGMSLGASLAIAGGIVAVSTGMSWALVAGFLLGIGVGITCLHLANKQLDYEPTGEIAPPLPPDPSPGSGKPDAPSGG